MARLVAGARRVPVNVCCVLGALAGWLAVGMRGVGLGPHIKTLH